MRMKAIFKVILYVGIIANFLFPTNLRLYKNNYNSSLYIFRRIREPKEELAVNYFIEELREKFGNGIETYSVPEELRQQVEIDIVVVYDGIKREELFDTVVGINYHIIREYNEVIIPVIIPRDLLQSKNIEDIFKLIKGPDFDFLNPAERGTPEDFYELGEVVLNLAESAYKKYEQTPETKYLYGALYNVFRACGEFMSAVIVYSGQQPAESHEKVLKQFYHLSDKFVPKRKRKQWKALKREVYGLMFSVISRRIEYFYRGRKYTQENAKSIKDMLRTTGMLGKFIKENIF